MILDRRIDNQATGPSIQEQVLYSKVIQAETLAPGKVLRVKAYIGFQYTPNYKQVNLKLGGQFIGTGNSSAYGEDAEFTVDLINDNGSLASFSSLFGRYYETGPKALKFPVSVDVAVDQTLELSGVPSQSLANEITVKGWTVELLSP